MNRRLGGGAGALVVTVGAALVAVALFVPHRHGDGEGTLGSVGTPITESMSVDPTNGATSWTFGVPLCLASGTEPVELARVAPVSTVGKGFEVLGMSIRSFERTPDHTPIISVEGWPPPTAHVPDAPSVVPGALISTPCVTHEDTMAHTELLIGLGKRGSGGGGWDGIVVSYRVGNAQAELEIDRGIQICGASVSCEIPVQRP